MRDQVPLAHGSIGFGFEHYDGIGKYRTEDNGKPVDSSGSIPLDGETKSFTDAVELVKLLVPATRFVAVSSLSGHALPSAGRKPMPIKAPSNRPRRLSRMGSTRFASSWWEWPLHHRSVSEASPRERCRNMDNDRFSRRALLAGLGASAAMLPLLEAEKAEAATSGGPKRLVCVRDQWRDRQRLSEGGRPTIGQTLKPLEAFKSKMLMPVGLDQKVLLDSNADRAYDGHFTWPTLLTGTAENKHESRKAMGPSIDQVISDALAKKVSLPAPLLNLGVQTDGDSEPTSWRAAGQKNVPEQDPWHLFDRLFASASLSTGQIDVLRSRRQSVMDYLLGDLNGFKKRLGTDDRAKVDAHMQAIRDLETQLKNGSAGGGKACTAPTLGPKVAADTPTLMKLLFNMAGLAIQCDLSRVITIDLYTNGGGDGNWPWLGITTDYHAVAHAGANSAADKIKIDAWIMEQVASLAKQLDTTTENGKTMLDNSVILVANDMNDGEDHYVGEIPFLLIGGGGNFKTGAA